MKGRGSAFAVFKSWARSSRTSSASFSISWAQTASALHLAAPPVSITRWCEASLPAYCCFPKFLPSPKSTVWAWTASTQLLPEPPVLLPL